MEQLRKARIRTNSSRHGILRLRSASFRMTAELAGPAADWVATAQAEAQGSAELVWAATDSVAWSSRERIAFTAVVCRKLDKREQSRRRNPSLFDSKKSGPAPTRQALAAILGD